jgi:hypothetical protein
MKTSSRFPLFLLLLLPFISLAQSPAFSFTDKKNGLQILYSKEGPKLDSIAAHLLARDIKMVTGNLPPVIADLARAKGNVVVIGNVTSMLVQQFIATSRY